MPTPPSVPPTHQRPQSRPQPPLLNPIESPSQAHARAQVQAQAQALSRTPVPPMDPIRHPAQTQAPSRTPVRPVQPLDSPDADDPFTIHQSAMTGQRPLPSKPAAELAERPAQRAALLEGQTVRALRPAVEQPAGPINAGSSRGASAPAPSVARPVDPGPDPEAESGNAEPYSVSTMVVPSAFVNAGAYSQGWGGPAQEAGSPFAGLPGFGPGPAAAAEERRPPQVRVVLLASPGSRLLAKIIDLFLALLMSSPATVTLLLVAHRHDHQYVESLRLKATTTYTTLGMDGTGIALWALAAVILIMAALLYEAFRVGAGGQTTGRRLVGIRVVRAGTGDRFRTGSALIRGALFWVLLLVPVVDVLTLGPVAWGRPYRQGLHDKLTRAVTVRAD
ncbi:MAG TPA: RDD family protein [Actinocrinis sp.]|nr:RDD family protein [Actinocrinis sp.]